MRYSFLLLTVFIGNHGLAQQPVPAKDQGKPVFIRHATIHKGNGELIENGNIAFQKGVITYIGQADSLKDIGYEVIDGTGKHVYPGFIACNTIIGLSEIEAARATNDYSEVGSINSNIRSLIAYNTDSKVTPTVRDNGILLAQSVPASGLISGQSSIMKLDGWNWEDAVYKADDAMHVFWPSSQYLGYYWAEPADVQKEKNKKNKALLEAFFMEAKAYMESPVKEAVNLRFESMRDVLKGERKLCIHADYVKDIVESVLFAERFGLHPVIVGGNDASLITDFLKEKNVPVILHKMHSVPGRDDADVDLNYKTPAILEKAGILFAVSVEGFWQVRNLPFNAGTAAAYGLDKEKAVSAITLNAAKILGIDKTTGSLEKGKDATLIISGGDALDMKSNHIERAFIQGRTIDLNNIQKALYKKYADKYGLKYSQP